MVPHVITAKIPALKVGNLVVIDLPEADMTFGSVPMMEGMTVGQLICT